MKRIYKGYTIEPKAQDGFYSCRINDKIFVVANKLKEMKKIIDFHHNQLMLDTK